MRPTTVALAGLMVAAVAAAPSSAGAKPKKPITKTYTATASTPDPSNYAGQGYSVCAQNVPGSFHTEEFKAPAAGKIKVELSGFTGDWDLLLLDSKGTEITTGGASDIGTPQTPARESMTAKIKKPQIYKIIACNWAGGPTGTVKYTFTYA